MRPKHFALLSSRQWRYSSTRIDQQFARIPKDGRYTSHVNKLLLRIDKARLLHDGPITEFLPEIPGSRPHGHGDIDRLVRYLSKKGFLPEARVLVSLIMSSPNLIELAIRIDDCDWWHLPEEVINSLGLVLEAVDIAATCFQCLEKFSMRSCWGTQIELEMVKLVLANAPLLGDVVIEFESIRKNSKDAINFIRRVM